MELIPASEIRKMLDEAVPKIVKKSIRTLNRRLRQAARKGRRLIEVEISARLVRDEVVKLVKEAGYTFESDSNGFITIYL